MNYKLAKQLKEAGFPFTKMEISTSTSSGNETKEQKKWNELLCDRTKKRHYCLITPTLEELIDACKDKSIVLWNVKKYSWQAGIYDYGDEHYIDSRPSPNEFGKTHLEAMAKLFIKLNKK